eukprot:jgi/Tetstr1/457854/TSEL_004256.t1
MPPHTSTHISTDPPTPPPPERPTRHFARICRKAVTNCRTYIKSYQGSKDHLDACGRPVSSPLHGANWAYGAQLDMLAAKPIDDDKARQRHELHGYQPPANPSRQPYPDRRHLEAYHVFMLTRHWELLHVADFPLFHNFSTVERRVEIILGVTCCIRFMHAV